MIKILLKHYLKELNTLTKNSVVATMGYQALGAQSNMLINPDYFPSFDELAIEYPEIAVPLLDQESTRLKGLSDDQKHWREHGYVIKRGLIPSSLVNKYLRLRKHLKLGRAGFPNPAPYLDHDVILDICCYPPLHYLLVDLLGEQMGLHFNLSDFKSSARGWHQDEYLNPKGNYGRYCAVWIAMGDIDPDSGPFEYVPGSHKWPAISGEKVRSHIVPEGRDYKKMLWPLYAEHFVNRAVENKISYSGLSAEKFIAKKGDVLIWHSRLAHRGSLPKDPSLTRPALIAHYSNVVGRRDFSNEISRHKNGGYFWDFGNSQFTEENLRIKRSVLRRAARKVKRLWN